MVGAVVIVVVAACGHREDAHNGQPINAWYQALHSPDPRVREQAATVIAKAAPEHPETLGALLVALAAEGDSDVHVVLAGALGALGPSAASAVPALVRLVRDDHEEVRSTVVVALGRIGLVSPAVLPTLLGALRDPSHDVRAVAADAIANAARGDSVAARVVVPPLTVAMSDPIGFVRWRAVAALAILPVPDSLALPLFARAFSDEFWKVRTAACEGAGRRGTGARALEPMLRRLAMSNDENAETRDAASNALGLVTASAVRSPSSR